MSDDALAGISVLAFLAVVVVVYALAMSGILEAIADRIRKGGK